MLELVKQKGVYPYEYMENFQKFSEDKFPDRCKFHSFLIDGCISEKDAVNIWNEFKVKSLGDYHDLYWTTDVLVLTDVFEKIIIGH